MPMNEYVLRSYAFVDDDELPFNFTVDGNEGSPPLEWTPNGENPAKSFAIVMEETNDEKGLLYHWIIWNLPHNVTRLSKNTPTNPILSDGSIQGMNDFGSIGYHPPDPAKGKKEKYLFKLFTFKMMLNIPQNTSAKQFVEYIKTRYDRYSEIRANYRYYKSMKQDKQNTMNPKSNESIPTNEL